MPPVRARPVFRPAFAVLLAAALVASTALGAGPLRGSVQALGRLLGGGRQVVTTVRTSPPAALDADATPASSRDGAHDAPPAKPLRLGVVVPRTGPYAAEGRDVVTAVERAVASANRNGGVGGTSVQVHVFAAEDPRAIASIERFADVLVGGFGIAPPSVGWILPADPAAGGRSVVQAQPRPLAAGETLAQDLGRRGFHGTVGVIIGPGSNASLGAGIARHLHTRSIVAAANTTCTAEIAALREAGVGAVAIAGPASLATVCVRASTHRVWVPAYGFLVAPSVAYDPTFRPQSPGVITTVLGVPWPTSDDPGSARFRAAVPGSGSYRALVSFAAAELAIQVARADEHVTAALVARGVWRSDLYWLDDGTNLRAIPSVYSFGGWQPEPETGPTPPPRA